MTGPRPPRSGKVAARLAAVLVACTFLAVAVHELPRYGPTFDAVLGDYAYGEHLLEFYRTGDRSHLEFGEHELSYYGEDGHPRWKTVYPSKWVYPVPAVLSAASCLVFARTLHWLDPIDAHHLICPIAAALLLLLVYRLIEPRAGSAIALATMVALALYPRFFGHAMNNIKDAPTLLIVYAALWAWIRVIEDERGRHVVLASCLTGVGFATKVNAVWPIAFFVIAFFVTRAARLWRGDRVSLGFAAALLTAPAIVIGAYLAASSNLYVDGWRRFAEHASYALVESVRVEGRDYVSWAPLQNLLFVTPPLYLLLAPIGMFALWRRRAFRPAVRLMLALLLIVPVLRPCMPSMRYFNVIRHSLEVLPVLSLLVGAGAVQVIVLATRRVSTRGRAALIGGALSAAMAAPEMVAMVAIHPWQTTYFNVLAGGLGGRQRVNHLDANDYWCQSYREGVRWINAHADRGCLLLVPVAPWMVGAGRQVWLRDDIVFSEDDEAIRGMIALGLLSPETRDAAQWSQVSSIYFMFVPLSKRYNLAPHAELVRFCEQRLTPVHEIRSDGGVILSIYRMEI